MEKYIPTGNERVSLPTIEEAGGAVRSVGFLLMSQRGMVELRGRDSEPLMAPFLQRRDARGEWAELPLSDCRWHREHHWIPVMNAAVSGAGVRVTYLTPVEERGFGLRMELSTPEGGEYRLGLRGCWAGAWHCVNEEKQIEGTKHCYHSPWNDSLVFDFRCGFPVFALAPMADAGLRSSFVSECGELRYELSRTVTLAPGGSEALTVFWGLGFEEVAAATSAKELLRRGWDWEYEKTAAWLRARERSFSTPKRTELYNTNLFFCMFYSTGVTLDTEELVCVTSRSPRYYVSAAYWDRDTLLWAFPAILDADRALAHSILEYVFTRQQRNFGVHSRYLDGTVLEPGFELDELVAPIIALAEYAEATGDTALFEERFIRDGAERILSALPPLKSPRADLYETFLQPTDDEIVYPYLTYDNVLVWHALTRLAALLPQISSYCLRLAEKVKSSIYDNCVFGSGEDAFFGWSVDLKGNHDVYDEPPGSLQLLPYYGFCNPDDPVWRSTVRKTRSPDYAYSFADQPIAEIGCPHAPYPWVLSICNSLLSGHEEQAWRELEELEMDNGIACESVDPVTGACATGAAFATCAGFLCHSMLVAERKMTHAK